MSEYNEDKGGKFIPQAHQYTVRIPITVDYQGGRAEKSKYKWLWATAMLIAILAISIGMLLQKGESWPKKILVTFLFFSVTTLFLRFAFLKEGRIRDRMVNGKESNYDISTNCFWGITRVNEDPPFICTFPNNRQGIFVRMEKGVFKGDLTEAKHRHRMAISEFFKFVGDRASGAMTLTVTHIDLMDYVGTDDRIDRARDAVTHTDNPYLKEEILKMYAEIKNKANQMVYTSDIFVFQWTGQSRQYLDMIRTGLGMMMTGGGYVSYSYLDGDDLMELYKTLFNVTDFSLLQAKRDAVASASERDIRPIMVYYANGGREKLNYTREEHRKKQEYDKKHKEAEKRRRRNPEFQTTDLGVERPDMVPLGYNGRVVSREQPKVVDDDEEYIVF